MAAYYNEIEPYAAQWLRNLIAAGHIAAGDVDTRDIREVQPDDLKRYTQCHFFAGIGGWSLALRLAGIPDDRPVWTGSCPCQPFSAAGTQKGHGDERHLWPHWFRLIRECRPATIFGEQVAGAITFGWLDAVFNDLEAEAYACAAAVLPACSVNLPHKRDRLWFVAHAKCDGQFATTKSGGKRTPISNNTQRPVNTGNIEGAGKSGDVADTFQSRLEGLAGHDSAAQGWERQTRPVAQVDTLEWIKCQDGKLRPVKSGIRLLVNGFSGRVACLKAGGNAIPPQVAAEFIKACEVDL